MDDALSRLSEALPAWMNPTVQRGTVISEMLVNMRLLPPGDPGGEMELTILPAPNPLGPTTLSETDKVLRLTGSVDEFVELARQLDALFTPTESVV